MKGKRILLSMFMLMGFSVIYSMNELPAISVLNETCPVCLEVLTGDVEKLPNCPHGLHSTCRENLIDCPYCRKVAVSRDELLNTMKETLFGLTDSSYDSNIATLRRALKHGGDESILCVNEGGMNLWKNNVSVDFLCTLMNADKQNEFELALGNGNFYPKDLRFLGNTALRTQKYWVLDLIIKKLRRSRASAEDIKIYINHWLRSAREPGVQDFLRKNLQ